MRPPPRLAPWGEARRTFCSSGTRPPAHMSGRRRARREHPLFRPRAARGGPARRPRRRARRAGGGRGDRLRRPARISAPTLHAVFVKKHEHTLLFDQVFDIYWKRKGFLEKLIAMMSPQARPDSQAEAGRGRRHPRRRRPVQERAAPGRKAAALARSRRALHHVGGGDPADARFRADERRRDRARPSADRASSSCPTTAAARAAIAPDRAGRARRSRAAVSAAR